MTEIEQIESLVKQSGSELDKTSWELIKYTIENTFKIVSNEDMWQAKYNLNFKETQIIYNDIKSIGGDVL
jgi:hypothetical protein